MVAETPTLDAGRLVLRPVARADIPAIARLANDAEVAKRTASIPIPYTVRDAEAWLGHLQSSARSGSEIVFAIERRSDRRFLGAVGLIIRSPDEPAEIGFWLGRRYWNRGYMTEAVRRVVAFALQELGFPAVRAAAFVDNAASIRVQEKVGLSLVGREVRPAPARGGDRELEVREVTREAWAP